MKVKIAVGVGNSFAIVDTEQVRGIDLKNTGTIVIVDKEPYPLYKGTTYEESRKVDALFDEGRVEELSIANHLPTIKRTYDVTITRFGCVKIQANSAEEAMKLANLLPTEEVEWNEEWEATDAVCE
jgi:hypothetical protein